ncbi:MAG: flagellar basal body rod protein FlgC [Dehalobacterium sp.]
MSVFQGMAISTSALTAEKLHLDIIANNIANIESTRTPEGGPYQRKVAVFEELVENEVKKTASTGRGVHLKEVVADEVTPYRVKEEPNHPDADQDGNVLYPNVDLTGELIDMITAQRSYQVNAYVYTASRTVIEKALEI